MARIIDLTNLSSESIRDLVIALFVKIVRSLMVRTIGFRYFLRILTFSMESFCFPNRKLHSNFDYVSATREFVIENTFALFMSSLLLQGCDVLMFQRVLREYEANEMGFDCSL